MELEINVFDPKSVRAAIKKINKYKQDFLNKEQMLLEKLGDLGVTKAQILFDNAVNVANASPIHAYVDNVSVSKGITNNTLVITASGKDVAFIEFGAGVRYGYGYPEVQASGSIGRPEGIVGIGQYGKKQGANPKGWWYYTGETDEKGKKLVRHSYGNQPAMAMYYTEEEIIEKVTEVAREVFKS